MLIYRKLDIDKIDIAIRDAIVRDRGIVYNHALNVIRTILEPLTSRGMRRFNLTRSEIMNRGIPQRTAANVIKLLLKAGVIVDTGETEKVGNYRPMTIYRIGDSFATEKRPTNYDELEVAVVQAGYKSSDLSIIRSQMERERVAGGKITTAMLIDRIEDLVSRTLQRQNRSYYFSGKGGI